VRWPAIGELPICPGNASTLPEIVAIHGLQRFAVISDIEGAEASRIFDDPALDQPTRMVIGLHKSAYLGRWVAVNDVHDGLIWRGFVVLEQQDPVFALTCRLLLTCRFHGDGVVIN